MLAEQFYLGASGERSMLRVLGSIVLILVWTAPGMAQKPSFIDMKKEVRLQWIIDQAAEYELQATYPKVKLRREKPVLRFNDNVSGVVDAVLFVWMKDGRPEASASFWFNKRGKKAHEFISLSRTKLEAKRNNAIVWATDQPGLDFKPVPKSPVPSASKSVRMSQMRQIARRCKAAETIVSREFNLRFLPQPMIRYEPKATQLLDGAIFNFAKGTNPEVLLVIEATVDSDGTKQFEYAPVRMTSRECWLIMDNKKVWSVPGDAGHERGGTYRNLVTYDRG